MTGGAWVAALGVAFLANTAHGHGGGLNAEGCHHNRKTGDYHCHRASLPTAPPMQKEASRPSQPGNATAAASNTSATSTASGQTCYVGPRGGTYTITKSGRKNYGGC